MDTYACSKLMTFDLIHVLDFGLYRTLPWMAQFGHQVKVLRESGLSLMVINHNVCCSSGLLLDFSLILRFKLPVVDRIHPQSNKFVMVVENKTAGDFKLSDSAGNTNLNWFCCNYYSDGSDFLSSSSQVDSVLDESTRIEPDCASLSPQSSFSKEDSGLG